MTIFRDRCITFFTDNEALVHVINTSTCRNTSLMIFVRTCKLVLVCLKHNILFKAKHVSGFKNTLADALSRLQDRTFHENRSTSLYGSHANSNPIPYTPSKLASIVHDLLSASLQKSSIPTYRRAWKLYLWRISNKCFSELTHFFTSDAGHIGIVCCTFI